MPPLSQEGLIRFVWEQIYCDPSLLKCNAPLDFLTQAVGIGKQQSAMPFVPATFELFLAALPLPTADWQRVAMQKMIKEHEYALLCCRKAGKTEKMTIVATWYGLKKYDGHKAHLKNPFYIVLWYSAGEAQLEEVRRSFRQLKPYVSEVKDTYVLLCNGNRIDLHCITEKQTHSPEADVLILDEGRSAKLQQREQYRELRHCIAASDVGHIIHGSTPGLETAIYDSAGPASELAVKGHVEVHSYRDCPWISAETIESERKALPKWEFDLNYEAKWTVPGGAIFEDIEVLADVDFDNLVPKDVKVLAGCDYNGMPGNVLIAAIVDDKDIWILDEKVFESQDTRGMADYCDQHHYDLEQETGGYNEGYAKDVNAIGQDVTQEWKGERVNFARHRTIRIKASLQNTVKDIQSIPWQSDGTVKINAFHYVAAFLHACHQEHWIGAISE